MNTTATNRKIRVLLKGIRDESLIPRPEFQRRLVWNARHKREFLTTVLMGYPFPEIYIAAGEVDPDTGEGTEMLVDGQQRMTTLFQYFIGAPELRLGDLTPYVDLEAEQKRDFLEYEVVVRDLGRKTIDEIREIFTRINSTRYALNAMELHNARFDGAFKKFGEELAADEFFDEFRVFHTTEVRRMGDVRFALTLVATMMSTYFNRDDELESFLTRYDDEFPEKDALRARIQRLLTFLRECELPRDSRAWNTADLLTLLVEIDRAFRDELELDPQGVRKLLTDFYGRVEDARAGRRATRAASEYLQAARAASADRTSRVTRGRIIGTILHEATKS